MNKALRTVHCPMCGTLEDTFVDLDTFIDGTFACPTEGCEFRVQPEIGAPQIIGIQSASPEVSRQLGKTFRTSAEKQTYLRSKGLVEMPVGSREEVAARDHARNRADYAAKKMGHNDEQARRVSVKKEQAKGWTPTPGDGMVKTATR